MTKNTEIPMLDYEDSCMFEDINHNDIDKEPKD
jgi:hypothetical protein